MRAPRSAGGRAWLGTRGDGRPAITAFTPFTPDSEGDGRESASNTKESPGATATGKRPGGEEAQGRFGDPSRVLHGNLPILRLPGNWAEEVPGGASRRPWRVPLKFAGRKTPRLLPSLRIGEGGGSGGSAADTGVREGGERKGRGRRKASREPPAAPASRAQAGDHSAPQRTLLGRPGSPGAPGRHPRPQPSPQAPGPSPSAHPRPEWGASPAQRRWRRGIARPVRIQQLTCAAAVAAESLCLASRGTPSGLSESFPCKAPKTSGTLWWTSKKT